MVVARSLSYAIDAKDSHTHGHSLRVSQRAMRIAEALGLSPKEKDALELAALLHDIGKMRVPVKILNKKGPLTEEEYDVVKEHPITGFRILREITSRDDVACYVRHHHERYDGNGYPDGLAGRDIPKMSRILAVADVYDAITSRRPYRNPRSASVAVSELRKCAGSQFDPEMVDIFVGLFGKESGRKQSSGTDGCRQGNAPKAI